MQSEDMKRYQATSPFSSKFQGTTGAVSTSPVSGTLTRTIPKPTALGRVFSAVKTGAGAIARNHPIGRAATLCTIICPMLELPEYGGYKYDEEKEQFYSGTFTHVLTLSVAKHNWNGTSVWKDILEIPTNLNDKNEAYQRYKSRIDTACANDTFSSGADYWIKEKKCSVSSHNSGCFAIISDTCDGGNWGIVTLKKLPENRTPLTEERFIELMEALIDSNPEQYLPYADIPDSDFSQPQILIVDGSLAQSAPYTNPQTGQAEQASWRFSTSGKGDSAETVVTETITPRPDLKPYTGEAPLATAPPSTSTGTETETDGKNPPPDNKDLCEKNPDILACDKQPEKPAASAPAFDIPTEEIPLTFEPDGIFPENGTCPAPVSFDVSIPFSGSKTFALEYTQVCDAASRLRGLIIAVAWLAVAFLATKAIRS